MNLSDRLQQTYKARNEAAAQFIGPVPAPAAKDIFTLTVYLVRAGVVA